MERKNVVIRDLQERLQDAHLALTRPLPSVEGGMRGETSIRTDLVHGHTTFEFRPAWTSWRMSHFEMQNLKHLSNRRDVIGLVASQWGRQFAELLASQAWPQ